MSHSDEKDAARERLWTHALNTDECHGIVTRDGIEEPCEKPTTCIIDDPDGGPWAACIWHAHRYGGGRMVTLAAIRSRVIPPTPDLRVIPHEVWLRIHGKSTSVISPAMTEEDA